MIRVLLGLILIVLATTMPFYIGMEILPEGWSESNPRPAFWWTLPGLLWLAAAPVGMFYLGIIIICCGRENRDRQ